MLVNYAGTDPEVREYLARKGERIDVPDAVFNQQRAGAFIENKVREAIAKEAAEAAQEAADAELLNARMDQQRSDEAAADAAAAEQARIAADEQRRAELRAELKNDVDRLASTNIQAAAALQTKATVIEEQCDQWRAEATEIYELIRAERSALDAVKDELVELLAAVQQAQGRGALSVYELNKRLERLEGRG